MTTSNTRYQYVKLGMSLEFLRGVCSTAVLPAKTIGQFPHLAQNLPANRYDTQRVMEAIKAIHLLLEALQLPRSSAAAESLRPMLESMEQFQQENPEAPSTLMNDNFAEQLIVAVNGLARTIKEETA